MSYKKVHFGSKVDILFLTLQTSQGDIAKPNPIKLIASVMEENDFPWQQDFGLLWTILQEQLMIASHKNIKFGWMA